LCYFAREKAYYENIVMMLEAILSLIIIILLAAHAVNIYS